MKYSQLWICHYWRGGYSLATVYTSRFKIELIWYWLTSLAGNNLQFTNINYVADLTAILKNKSVLSKDCVDKLANNYSYRYCVILFQDPHKCHLKLKEVCGLSWALANLPRRRPELSLNMFNEESVFIQRMSEDLCLWQIKLIKWRYSNYVSCSQGAVGSSKALVNRSKLPFMKNGRKNRFASIIMGSKEISEAFKKRERKSKFTVSSPKRMCNTFGIA